MDIGLTLYCLVSPPLLKVVVTVTTTFSPCTEVLFATWQCYFDFKQVRAMTINGNAFRFSHHNVDGCLHIVVVVVAVVLFEVLCAINW